MVVPSLEAEGVVGERGLPARLTKPVETRLEFPAHLAQHPPEVHLGQVQAAVARTPRVDQRAAGARIRRVTASCAHRSDRYAQGERPLCATPSELL